MSLLLQPTLNWNGPVASTSVVYVSFSCYSAINVLQESIHSPSHNLSSLPVCLRVASTVRFYPATALRIVIRRVCLTVLYVAIDVLPNPLQPRTWLCFEAVDDGRVPPGWPMKRSRLLIATHILYAEESVWHLPRTDSGRNLRATALRGSNKRLQQF
jgi:hypothetical protein